MTTATNRIEIQNGSRKVLAARNDAESPWSARLYVNHGETPTLIHGAFRTEAGLRKWAAKQLAK